MATINRKRPSTKMADKNRARRGKPKFCVFCAEHTEWVDYKDTNVLRRFMSDRGKIKSRANNGTCAQHQRAVATAIKTARELALLPYATRTFASDKLGGRPRSLGVIGTNDFTARPLLASYDNDVVTGGTYAVTVEQAGGSPDGAPHSTPVFAGKLIETVPPPR